MSRETISLFFTGMLVVCALVVTGLVVKREFFNQPSALPETRFVEDWQQVAASGNVIGLQNAPVKIVEFFDYQCPFCGQLKPVLEEIRQRYPEKVALVARHFPLPNHPQALPAARAAECAAEQGRFASYHDLLFARDAKPDGARGLQRGRKLNRSRCTDLAVAIRITGLDVRWVSTASPAGPPC